MRKEIYEVLYGYALECKSKKIEKNRNEHTLKKNIKLYNEPKNLQKNR